MNHQLASKYSACFLLLAVSIVTALILLINISFKIIVFHNLIFSVNSLICPLVTVLYLIALRKCSFKEQQHLLHIGLISLYVFCVGVYVLVNLPAAEYIQDKQVYQIVFDDIPKKFFAMTLSFALSFYLPHLIFCRKSDRILSSARKCLVLALSGGICFFSLNFFFLFSERYIRDIHHIFTDSFLINILLLVIMGILYLSILLKKQEFLPPNREDEIFPLYPYLICIAVIIMLICLACEYRIISFIGKNGILSASAIFFPLTLIISTIISEKWGYQASLKFSALLIASQFIFDSLLMGIMALPSPEFFNLNSFYNYIMLRRLPAASLTLFATFISNALLLHYLKEWKIQRFLRIIIANICANSLLCIVDYSVLYGGIYSYEQIINLVFNVWQYKLFVMLASLPAVLKICHTLDRQPHAVAFA